MHTRTIKPLLYLVMMAALLCGGIASANVKAVTGQLSLMAMLGGKPAFRTVLWKLTPNSQSSGASPIQIQQHAATLDLQPGSYQISVSLGNKTRTYQIIIKESSKQELIVNLD